MIDSPLQTNLSGFTLDNIVSENTQIDPINTDRLINDL
jgi:hypothetical protein